MTTDDLVLSLLRAGHLRVDLQTGRVWRWHSRRRTWHEKKEQTHYRSGRAWFQFRDPARRNRTVYKNRLLKLARDGFAGAVVDHQDGDRRNDAADNLRDHSRRESARQGRDVQRARVVANAKAFFDYIAFWGEEPPDHLNVPGV